VHVTVPGLDPGGDIDCAAGFVQRKSLVMLSPVQRQERVMSLQASQVVVSRQGDAYEIVFENSGQQAVVRLSQGLLIHLSRQITRALGGSGRVG
jgi:hypothetical protein